jgi:hypothetical protein
LERGLLMSGKAVSQEAGHFVTWKQGSRWGKWHRCVDAGVTICGRAIPAETMWHGPLNAPFGNHTRVKLEDECRTCRQRFFHERPL